MPWLLYFIWFVADVKECATDPCDVNANCEELPGAFNCECRIGYTGDGFNCIGKQKSCWLIYSITYDNSV